MRAKRAGAVGVEPLRREPLAFALSCTIAFVGCAEDERGPIYVEYDPSSRTPLSAALHVHSQQPTSVSVEVLGAGGWVQHFEGSGRQHELALHGFRPGERYELRVSLTDAQTGTALPQVTELELETRPLPDPFPVLEPLVSSDAAAPGHTLFNVEQAGSYLIIVDHLGELVWFYRARGETGDARMLPDGTLLFIEGGEIVQMDLLGKVLRRLRISERRDLEYHHEVFPMPDGTLLTLGQRVTELENFPLDYDDPSARGPAQVTDDLIIEIDPTGSVVYKRPLLELLDPNRLGFDSLSTHPWLGTPNDWAHANAVIPSDDGRALIVSCRHQDAVFEVERASGKLSWILANPEGWSPAFAELLLEPVGEGFRWPYHQHAPQLTSRGSLLLFDNGNYRGTPRGTPPLSPAESESRAVEYLVDEVNMRVEQIWEYEYPAARLFAFAVGDADSNEASGTVLLTYGALTAVGDQPSSALGRGLFQSRLIEVEHTADAPVVFELDVYSEDVESPGWIVYRAERIPALR